MYAPGSDPAAVHYFQALEHAESNARRTPPLRVVVLPEAGMINGPFVRHLDGAHGILSLKLTTDAKGKQVGVPYVVPGGRFNELYYWDSYFIVLGLLHDERKDLARGTVDNLLYEMDHYGKIPNANRTYYLTRSQPPLLTAAIAAVYHARAGDRMWLASALKTAIAEYRTVWLDGSHQVTIGTNRLSRYCDSGDGPCPEVESGHYDGPLAPWLERANRDASPAESLTPFEFLNQYQYCGQFADVAAGGLTLKDFFRHDRAVRESGHDTTHRFEDRCADFVTVDLNSLLYRYETDLAGLVDQEFGGTLPGVDGEYGSSSFWRQAARARKEAMLNLMWDDRRGYFFDYDYVERRRSTYISATGMYPLWAKVLDENDANDRTRALRVADYARTKLEEPAGLVATAEESVVAAAHQDPRQWDYPYGWAPHQILAWQGLRNYGLDSDAGRLAYRWLFTIARNARDYNGTIPEKYNVMTGSHEVFVEYGNVGTRFSYIAPEGFGWMNASFEVGVDYLTDGQRADLRAMKPPP